MKISTSSTSRVRTSFDPELELPKLHQWFAENPHPSRLTLQLYVKELNNLASRQSRKLLEVHNLCYWFKNARAAYKRAELRMKKVNHHHHLSQHNQQPSSPDHIRNGLDGSSDSISPSSQSNGQQQQRVAVMSSGGSPPLQSAIDISDDRSLNSKSSIRPSKSSPGLLTSKKLYYPRTHPMMMSYDGLSSTTRDNGLVANCDNFPKLVQVVASSMANNDSKLSPGFMNAQHETSANTSDTGSAESLTRAECTSPSSTVSIVSPGGVVQQQNSTNFNNIDLASAVNCLLNTATKFTAAAAAAAAAASTTLNSGGLAPAATQLLHAGPHSAATINLAAQLLNSNFVNVGQGGANTATDQAAAVASIAAALTGHRSTALAAAAAAALVDQPMRHLFTAFNPSSYQFALGMLDNKMLDSNILNTMAFPTSACASDGTFVRQAFGAHSNSSTHNQGYQQGHQHNGTINNATTFNDHNNQNHRNHHHHNQQQQQIHHRVRLTQNGSRTNGSL